MIYRIYPTKDTFITNDHTCGARQTGSNTGRSEELSVFKKSGISGAIGTLGSSSLGRILIQFDLDGFSSLTGSGEIRPGGTFHLRLSHKTSTSGAPTSFDLSVVPVSKRWDEGRGMDTRLGDKGFANWMKPTSTEFWTVPGGDFLLAPTASVHFDDGIEDLEADISEIVESWLEGSAPNNGVAVKLSDAIESDQNYSTYDGKKFYSRQSGYSDRRPYIEYRVNDFTPDDRLNMQWGRSGSLFLYNLIGGQYQDLPTGDLIVTISDASGTLAHTTASHVGVGLYSASFLLSSGSYSGSVFYDSWSIGGSEVMSGRFLMRESGPTSLVSHTPLVARIRNIRDEYVTEEVVTFEVFFRQRGGALPVLSTASLGSNPYIVEKAYYAIENDSTRERVVPFGTGSQEHTRLSYNAAGNHFTFHMRNLHSGNVYRILFLVDENGRKQIIDPGVRFKVI